MKIPQTTIAPTFLTHIISGIDGVAKYTTLGRLKVGISGNALINMIMYFLFDLFKVLTLNFIY